MSEEWPSSTLGESSVITIGRTPPRKEPGYWTTSLVYPFCTIADMDGLSVDPKREGVTQAAISDGKAKKVPAGSLLMSFKLTIGRVGFAARDVYPNEAIAWIKVTDPHVDERFLALWLGSQDLTAGSGRAVKGETLNGESLRAIVFPVPPLEVQRRIVDLMAHLDAHLENLRAEREAVEMVLALLRAELAVSASTVSLVSLAAPDGIQIGPFGSQLHAHEYAQVGIPVVMPRDLVRGKISDSKISRVPATVASRLARHSLRAGDIVFPRRGDLSKRALVTANQEGWICGTGCLRFRPAPGVDGRQVFESISGASSTDWLIEHAVGTTMLNLNTQILCDLPVPDPNSGSARVASACSAASAAEDALRAEAAAVIRVRTGLLAALLTGETKIDTGYDLLLVGAA